MHRTVRCALALLAAGAVVAPAAQAEPLKVTGDQTAVTLTGAAVDLLSSNGVAVAAAGPATLDGATATFPVRRGWLNAKATMGIVRHTGGLTFTKDGASLTVRRPVAVVARRAAFIAVRGRGRLVRLFRLRDLQRSVSGTTLTVSGDLLVTARLARALERRLGVTVAPGAPAGTATSTLTP